MKLVAVTSCPTGIAHTYMAAEALEQAGQAAGHDLQVETQGAAGADRLAPEAIAAADAVIFGVDVEVRDRQRFQGKPIIQVSVKKAIADAPGVIEQAVQAARGAPAPRPAAAGSPIGAPSGPALTSKVTAEARTATRVRQWLMTGVSYMIPFVAAGGILIALSFMVAQAVAGRQGAIDVTKIDISTISTTFDAGDGMHWAALLFWIGKTAFGFLVPALAGFIAFAIADRPGIAPGFVGGSLSVTIGAGFLGGMAAGLVGGLVALWLARRKVPKSVRGVLPVVVIPLVATLFTGAVMLLLLGRPLKWVSDELTRGLDGLSGANLVILGVLLGLMMAFDMGGPVNKVAYTFATTGLAAAGTAADATQLRVMAAVMAAGMTPPLGMALAARVRPSLFSEPERENGNAAWLLGASFITEGAIAFAAVDALRVIPSLMVGSAVTGGLVMNFGSTLRAPHGGIWVTPLISGVVPYLVALAVGTVITTLVVVTLKQVGRRSVDVDPAQEPLAAA
ncbi:MAG TPA: fructose-specific PTS transporter subunit EIIC [Kineosporiaceae bacterium]